MPDIVDNDFVTLDLIYDQIIADRETPKPRFTRCLSHERRLGNSRRNFLDTSDETRSRMPIVLGYICENLIEIGKCTALVSELHALR